jgi:hypothetical protein
MTGDTDLERMLSTLDVERRSGTYTFVTGDHPDLTDEALAVIEESEGTTLVLPVDVVRRAGLTVAFEAAWLTLTVFSALEAVGLTAAVSRVLADAGISCNMLAGYHHDHLLVPVDRADEAATLLRGLSSR